MRTALITIGILTALLIIINACKKDSIDYSSTNYPPAIAKIVVNKCAIAGCHDNASYLNASGLNLTTWDKLMQGGDGGAAVIPYRVDFSPFVYFCNQYKALGITSPNLMPPVGATLSQDEIVTLQNWVTGGAPNAAGYVAFSDNPNRHKVYVINSGCNTNTMTVIDGATSVAMRVVNIGLVPGNTPGYGSNPNAHDIQLTPDGQHVLIAYRNSRYLEVYSTTTDMLENRIDLVAVDNNLEPSFDIVTISSDGSRAYVSSFNNSAIVFVDLKNKVAINKLTGITNAHGLALSPDNDSLYVASQVGNYIWKITKLHALSTKIAPPSHKISIDPAHPNPSDNDPLLPHQIKFSPDGSKYFVSCQGSQEVRVINTTNDSVLKIIKTGTTPQEIETSARYPYLFVSCTDDSTLGIPLCRGAVTVINYNTLANRTIKGDAIHTKSNPYQPHGIDVDDLYGKVYVANENTGARGPAPHHVSACNARDGYMTALDISSGDMNTMHWIYTYRPEVSVFPYEAVVK